MTGILDSLIKTAMEGEVPNELVEAGEESVPEPAVDAENVASQIDLTQLSDEELMQLQQAAEAVQEGDLSEPDEVEDVTNRPLDTEDAEKMASDWMGWQDLLGRVQAHGFHSEMRKIAQEEEDKAAKEEADKTGTPPPPPAEKTKKKEEETAAEKTASVSLHQEMTRRLMDYYGA